jgi:hypothetical protein
MRRYGSSKRNPNPKWPCEQAVVVIPPGSNGSAVGRMNESTRIANEELIYSESTISEVVHQREDNIPIMNYMEESQKNIGSNMQQNNLWCNKANVSDYLCEKKGSYAKVEFMFGENIHVEKNGILENVGKDFLVLKEVGTGTQVVCSVKNIKFINIYEVKR